MIEGVSNVWVRGDRSSNELLGHLKDFEVVMLEIVDLDFYPLFYRF